MFLGAVLVLTAGWLSLSPPNTTTYRIAMAESGQLRSGDDVRVAGVPMGTVSKLTLRRNDVEVTVRVNRDAFIGDQSFAAVKMLTAVGGYYLDIDSQGTKTLAGALPAARVRLPYTLSEVFQEGGEKVSAVDPQPLRESLVQIQKAGSSKPGQLDNAISTLAGMVNNLGKQRDQIGRFISVVSEYTETINANGDRLAATMRDMNTFVSIAAVNASGFKAFLLGLDLTLRRIKPIGVLYQRDVDAVEKRFRLISAQVEELLKKFDPMIDDAKKSLQRLSTMVRPDGSIDLNGGATNTLPSFCVPIQGVNC